VIGLYSHEIWFSSSTHLGDLAGKISPSEKRARNICWIINNSAICRNLA